MKNKILMAVLNFIFAAILIALGIILLPEVTKFGTNILYFVLAGTIIVYVLLYLIRLAIKYKGIKQVFIIIEIVLDAVLAASLVISKIGTFINIKESFEVIGLLIWLHAVCAIMRGYFSKDNKGYPFYLLCIDLALLTISTYLFAKPPFSNNQMLYITSVISFIGAVVSITYGVMLLKKDKKKNA